MNSLYWMEQHLHLRVILGTCYLNVRGETFGVTKIEGPDERGWLDVNYDEGKQRLKISLHDLGAMSDPTLFHFSNSDPDGRPGTLVIPELGLRGDGEDDEEDA